MLRDSHGDTVHQPTLKSGAMGLNNSECTLRGKIQTYKLIRRSGLTEREHSEPMLQRSTEESRHAHIPCESPAPCRRSARD
jgi:hypothetical protein